MNSMNATRTDIELDSTAATCVPLGNVTMLELFDHLEDCLNFCDCDHSHRHTEAFLVTEGLAPQPTIRWLTSLGADCDCSVLAKLDLSWSAEDESPRVSRAWQDGV